MKWQNKNETDLGWLVKKWTNMKNNPTVFCIYSGSIHSSFFLHSTSFAQKLIIVISSWKILLFIINIVISGFIHIFPLWEMIFIQNVFVWHLSLKLAYYSSTVLSELRSNETSVKQNFVVQPYEVLSVALQEQRWLIKPYQNNELLCSSRPSNPPSDSTACIHSELMNYWMRIMCITHCIT